MLTTKDDNISLDLKVGSFIADLKTGQNLKLIQNGKTANVSVSKSGKIKFNKKKGGAISIRGNQVQINAKNISESTSNKSNETLKLDKNLNITKIKNNISLVFPKDQGTVWKKESGENIFSWSVSKPIKGKKYLVEIYKSEGLKTKVWSKKVKAKEIAVTGLKRNGYYYWKVSQGKKNNSNTGKFLYVSGKALALIKPKNGEYFSKKKEEKITQVSLAWEKRKFISTYRIQTSLSSNFGELLEDR